MRGVFGAMVLAAFAVSCGGGGDGPAPPGGGGVNTCTSTSSSVTVQNNSFSPSCTNVTRTAGNVTVTWTWGNNATNGHNVTFPGGPASQTQTSGTFERTFTSAGTFQYSCTVHPGMNGEIRVQ